MESKRRILGVQRETVAEVLPSGTDENSQFQVGDELTTLLDEVLNNKTRSILIFDDFSGRFTDFDLVQLATVIKFNTSLVAITISGVDIGDEAVGLLCQSLVRTNVQYIDFTNTPLDEEAGGSLAALAHCNQNLRTVIVTDTLISEEMMDEIDVACMNNEAEHDAPPVVPIDPKRTMYCVAHVFQACPNGDYCLMSHAPPGCVGNAVGEYDWEKALPPPPKEGATWRGNTGDDDDDGRPKLKIDLKKAKMREVRGEKRVEETSKPAAVDEDDDGLPVGTIVMGTVVLCSLALLVVTIVPLIRRR